MQNGPSYFPFYPRIFGVGRGVYNKIPASLKEFMDIMFLEFIEASVAVA